MPTLKELNGAEPWKYEPSWAVGITTENYIYVVKRNGFGAYCGYIGVNKTHPAYGVEDYFSSPWDNVSVYGGVTFCDSMSLNMDPELWFVGFDCAHAGDYMPYFPEFGANGVNYRDIEFVKKQINRLSKSLKELED